MLDRIHDHVRDTLGQSRLLPKAEGILLTRKEDIVHVGELLGSGAFSRVSSVICRDGKRYACKHLQQELLFQSPDAFQKAAAELAVEAHMMASFDHPNILKIRGWSYNGIASYEDGYHDSFFLLLDILDETLEQRIDRWRVDQLINKHDSSIYLQKLNIMSEIASALAYLHERGVCYRDLKPNNIGFLGGRTQLYDFGLSRELPVLNTSIPFEMSGKVGTLRYMANEVALGASYNVSADVFSFAIVAYELLSLQKPYDGWTREMHTTLVCERGLRPDLINCLCPIPINMGMLLQLAWHSIPEKRPTMKEISLQIEILKEQERSLLEQQQLEMQVAQQWHEQRRTQQERATRAFMAAQLVAPSSRFDKHRSCYSRESINTIETASLSSSSFNF